MNKSRQNKQHNPIGRPPAINDDVLRQLDYAYSIGCNDTEAALYADISSTTLYKYIKEHPDYATRRDELKQKPILKAKKTIIDSIESGNEITAKWYLEKRCRDDFGTVQDININATGNLSIQDKEQALKSFLSGLTADQSD